MIAVRLRSLRKGSLFRLHDVEAAPFWVRSVYDRSTKKVLSRFFSLLKNLDF